MQVRIWRRCFGRIRRALLTKLGADGHAPYVRGERCPTLTRLMKAHNQYHWASAESRPIGCATLRRRSCAPKPRRANHWPRSRPVPLTATDGLRRELTASLPVAKHLMNSDERRSRPLLRSHRLSLGSNDHPLPPSFLPPFPLRPPRVRRDGNRAAARRGAGVGPPPGVPADRPRRRDAGHDRGQLAGACRARR